jgi:methyltransferase family protein
MWIIPAVASPSSDPSRTAKALRYLRLRPASVFALARCFFHNLAGAALSVAGVKRVRCNLCGWRGARFAAHPDGSRVKYGLRCPRCASSPRYRLFVRYLETRPELRDPRAVLLDFAPEPSLRAWLQSVCAGAYVTADLRAARVAVHTDLTMLGFKSACADVVLCSHVLEHVPDDLAGMKEILRILKPGAWGILQVPMVASLPRTVEYGRANPLEHDHFRRYGADFPERLAAAGLIVESIEARSFASEDQVKELGLPEVPLLKARRER